MSDSAPDDQTSILLRYIDLAAEGASRTRLVLLALLVASVATFLASWNIRDDAWLKARLRVEEDMLRWWSPLHTSRKLPPTLLDPRRQQRFQEAAEEAKRFEQARTYFADRLSGGDAVDSARVAEEVQLLRKARVEDLLTLRIPFFGVVVDLNDLTLVSGVAFCAMLGWLGFALVAERRNLQFVFGKAKEVGRLPLCYDLLSMRQVFSTPAGQGEKPNWRQHGGWRRFVLIVVPMFVQGWVLYHHYESRVAAISISTAAASLGLTWAVIFSVIAAGLDFRCLWLSWTVDREWRDRANELVSLRPSRTQQTELLSK